MMATKLNKGGPAHRRGEDHHGQRAGWLRAAVLGADDGIVSVASLSIGVVASGASRSAVTAAAVAALVAGAMSMAAGEYVSVSSQRDTERGDLARERVELADDPAGETRELAAIYRRRGLPAALASQVAAALMAHDPVAAHARDELGLHDETRARPAQAALSSAVSFVVGALVPLLALVMTPARHRVAAVIAASIVALVVLGVAGARAGGANLKRAALRVGLWGSAAIIVTALVGHLFHSTAG
jgi:VIT1/CCC1 family predicted Fe2+/Mn2+ transporter